MNPTPIGKMQMMKGQQVRPTFRVDLSSLLKVAEAQNAATKTAQFKLGPNGVEDDSARPVEQEEIPSPESSLDAMPDSPPNPGQVPSAAGAAPAVGKPQAPVFALEDAGQEDPEQQRAESRSKVMKLRETVRQILDSQGLAHELNTSSDSLRVTVSIKPHVQAEDDGNWYPADQVMTPVVEKMFQLGFDVSEPTPAQAHRRYIDPKAPKIQYVFTYSAKAQQKAESEGAYTIPRRPANGTPVPQRPNSRMGVLPKAAEAPKTMRQVLASNKDAITNTALAAVLAARAGREEGAQ